MALKVNKNDKVTKGCPTCRFATWELRESGQPNWKRPGRCDYKIIWPKLPYAWTVINILPDSLAGIWKDSGLVCPCWQPK